MPALDYDDPKVEGEWLSEQHANIERYLQEQRLRHGGVTRAPSWFVAPYLSVWIVLSATKPDIAGWWAISGDLPTDHMSGQEANDARAALVHARPLWRAIDAGSWVIPQLVVTALMVDRDFPIRLVERVESWCPVSVHLGLSPVERHSATGPANPIQRSAKLLGSLLSVGAVLPNLSSWIAGIREEPTAMDLLKQDRDDAPGIAAAWQRQLVEQFSLRGRTLKPKAV